MPHLDVPALPAPQRPTSLLDFHGMFPAEEDCRSSEGSPGLFLAWGIHARGRLLLGA